MRQRVMIAVALACGPKLLFADEPTTALDVTVQAQILNLLARQQRERNMAMILVTHDLGVVAGRADDIAVMYAGQIVEKAPDRHAVPQRAHALHRGAAAVDPEARRAAPHPAAGHPRPPARSSSTRRRAAASRPRCPYAQASCHAEAPPLVESEPGHEYRCWFPVGVGPTPGAQRRQRAPHRPPLPRLPRQTSDLMAGTGTAHLRPAAESLLRVEDLVVEFPAGRQKVHAVSGVSIDVRRGETLGLVGESGCGKSTTGKAVIQLPAPTSGRVRFDGQDLTGLSGKPLRQVRTRLQLDLPGPDLVAEPPPQGARHPGRAAADLGPRRAQGAGRQGPRDARRGRPRPRRRRWTSGPTSSRAASASASRSPGPWSSSPTCIICDEPVSALDVSVQAQILNLLDDLKERYDLTLVFIAHDLAVVKNVSTGWR